jgi:amino acid permease
MNKKFWATAFTLTGAIVGAGVLGLPYVFSQSGFFIGVFWIIFLGLIMYYVNLALGEVTLRTKETYQLPGYAGKYLGIWGKRIMFLALVFGVYSALLAYLIGEGESFSTLFFGNTNFSVYFALGFWGAMTLLLKEGLKGLKRIETWGVIAIIGLVIGVFVWFFPQVDYSNVYYLNWKNLFIPFGVTLFALLGFISIPELRMEIKGQEKKFRGAIFLGILIPIILYVIFGFVFVGVLGMKVPEVATLAFGPVTLILGIFTMLTSYFVLSFALNDAFKYDLGKSKNFSFFFVSVLPLGLYLIVEYFSLAGFVSVLGIGGAISAGLTGIMILLVHRKAKIVGKRKPETEVISNWFVILLLSLMFIIGTVIELVNFFK